MKATILNRQGEQIEVTDLDKALLQCQQAIKFHRHKKGIKYPEALKDWEHIQTELQKIKTKLNHKNKTEAA